MPNVGSNEFKAAKGANNFVSGIPMGKDGVTGGPNNDGWKYGMAVYAHNGTSWVEVWNARPEVVSTSMATTSTGLTFSGTADPNNFATTAKFEYKEVGAGSYTNSSTTTTGLGNNIDGAVSYTVTAAEADTFKNWESRASATNTAGTGTGSTVTLDCRKHTNSGTGWDAGTGTTTTDATDCDSCGTKSKTDYTYTKSGCQSYPVPGTYGDCSGTRTYYSTTGTYNGIAYTAFTDTLGYSTYLRRNADGTGGCGCDSYYAWSVSYCNVTNSWTHTPLGCVQWVISCG